MITLHSNLDPVRRSLFLALGLIAACGDSKGDTTDAGTTSASSSSSSSSSGGSLSTGDEPTTATSEPTGSASATGTATGTTTDPGGTTMATSGVSATEAATTTGSSSDGTTAGEESSESGDTVGPDCVELMQDTDPPVPSGWVKCGDQLPHRAQQVTCEVTTTKHACEMEDPMGQCLVDADCVERPFGSCHQFDGIGFIGCGCVYGCETDADCDAGFVCRCGGDVLGAYTTCTPSECDDDGDCPGEVCQFAETYGEDCPLEVNDGHCSTPADACDSDQVCGSTGCLFDLEQKSWQCSGAICGRPFVVEDRPVIAGMAERGDWCGLVGVPAASPALAARLAAHWTEIGLYEHASVASFARFILQLLAVGAPAAMVTDAQRALADEVEHARVCFALASLYSGTGVGPGPLPQTNDVGVTGLAAITAAVVREACVGETLSALEVRESAARTTDPGLRRILEGIADDEQRHAELGWRFVHWARAQLDAAGQAMVAEVFAAAIAEAELQAGRMIGEAGTPELRAHGVVDAPLRAVVWGHGLRAVIKLSALALAA
jgi:hypothetical protein